MESFEIKELFAISGQNGLFKFKGKLRNNSIVMERLIDPKQRLLIPNKDISKLSKIDNIGVYVTDKDEPVKLETVLENIYSMRDQGIDIPVNMTVIGDRWPTVADFMEEVIPNHDSTKFKPYHMEKILKWYHEFVIALDMLDASLDAEDEQTSLTSDTIVVHTGEEAAKILKELVNKK